MLEYWYETLYLRFHNIVEDTWPEDTCDTIILWEILADPQILDNIVVTLINTDQRGVPHLRVRHRKLKNYLTFPTNFNYDCVTSSILQEIKFLERNL